MTTAKHAGSSRPPGLTKNQGRASAKNPRTPEGGGAGEGAVSDEEFQRALAYAGEQLRQAQLALSKIARGLRVKVLIHREESGGFWAQVPALPGCVTEGATREELLANLREAIQGVLLSPSGVFDPAPGGEEEEILM